MKFDQKSELKPEVGFEIATINTDTTTAGEKIDLRGFEAATILAFTGTRSAGTVLPVIKEADTVDGSFTAVAAENLVGTPSAIATAHTQQMIGYTGKKDFIEISATSASSANLQFGAAVIKGKPLVAPTA